MTVMRQMVLAVLLGLVACDGGGGMVMPAGEASPATWSSMIYAAKEGPILVTAEGAALGAPAKAWAPLAAAAMSGAIIGYPTRFTAAPGQAPRPAFRTILLLSPAAGVSDDAVCQGRGRSQPAPPGRLEILAAFCHDARLLSATRARLEGAAAPGDPAVTALLARLAREVFRPARHDLNLLDPWPDAD